MNVALQQPWTAEQFLDWAGAQEEGYEFDGFRPVAMTGGNARHDLITANISRSLHSRLRGKPCSNFGPNLGVETTNSKIRYPDALITCTKFPQTERIAPDVVIVFEVLSPTSDRTDRIEKVLEYAGVPSIRRYLLVESNFAGVTALHRKNAGDEWLTSPLTGQDNLILPEVALMIPVAELYEDVEFSDDPSDE
jgi:Uma2 family endonuclease